MFNDTEFSWEEYLKDCDHPAHFKDILLDPESGLFTGVAGDDVATVLRSASIRSFAKDEYLYTEDSPRAEVPLFLVLAGEFVVDQTIVNDEVRTVAVYGPGVLLNDVGCVLVGVTRNVLDRGRDGFALANVFPKEGGVVLEIRNPVETIWNIGASRLHLNIARLLAIKLINRAVTTEGRVLIRQRRLVVGQIKTMIAGLQPRQNPSMATSKLRPFIYDVGLLRSDLADRLRMKESSLYTICKDLWKMELQCGVSSGSFLWKGAQIQMSKPMRDVFLHRTSELY